MDGLPLDLVDFLVVDVHATAGVARDNVPDRWTVDGLTLNEQDLVVTGRLTLTRSAKRYRVGGIAIFRSHGDPVTALDQQRLATFVSGQGSHMLYSHLRAHLNALAGILDVTERFPTVAPIPTELLRSSESGWRTRPLNEVNSD